MCSNPPPPPPPVWLQVNHGANREALGEGSCLLEEEGEVRVHEAPAAQTLQTGGRGQG